ncbi:hypothetical protein NESM_000337600 [Novymonas esmeraldas]|uniref:Uncharacterized protein n=1 Tax=Novymonas esmeraldas TaxID=1808958 RepID=A0AAW0EM57_9TRYP
MRVLSLRELVVLVDTRLQQLTLGYLASGFFPLHTVMVAAASALVCGSLAVATAEAAATPVPLLYTSFTSFTAITVLGLMALTLLYRVAGGRFQHSPRAVGYVVDWIVDTICRPVSDDAARLLLAADKRLERGLFFLCVFVVGEGGKWLSFWPACTLASLVWCGWSARLAWRQHRCTA